MILGPLSYRVFRETGPWSLRPVTSQWRHSLEVQPFLKKFLQEKAKKQTNSILFITCNCYTSTRCYGRRIISKAISANLKLFSSLLCVYLSTIFYFVFQRPRIFLAFDIFFFGMISRIPSVKTQTVRYWYIRPNSKFFRTHEVVQMPRLDNPVSALAERWR